METNIPVDRLGSFDFHLVPDLGNLITGFPDKKHMFQLINYCCSSHPIKYFMKEVCIFLMDLTTFEYDSRNLITCDIPTQLSLIFQFLFVKFNFFLCKKGRSMVLTLELFLLDYRFLHSSECFEVL